MSRKKIPRAARALLAAMTKGPHDHAPAMDELIKRGLVLRFDTYITPERARVRYCLTPRGIAVAAQLARALE